MSRLRSEMSRKRKKTVSESSGTARTSEISLRVNPIDPAPIMAIRRAIAFSIGITGQRRSDY